jgi:hypothetical protein
MHRVRGAPCYRHPLAASLQAAPARTQPGRTHPLQNGSLALLTAMSARPPRSQQQPRQAPAQAPGRGRAGGRSRRPPGLPLPVQPLARHVPCAARGEQPSAAVTRRSRQVRSCPPAGSSHPAAFCSSSTTAAARGPMALAHRSVYEYSSSIYYYYYYWRMQQADRPTPTRAGGTPAAPPPPPLPPPPLPPRSPAHARAAGVGSQRARCASWSSEQDPQSESAPRS